MYIYKKEDKIIATSPNNLGDDWIKTDKEYVYSYVQNQFVLAEEIDEQEEAEALERIEKTEGLAQAKQNLIDVVQAHLDNACKERGYDNGFACASYATSSVPKFKAEAEAYVLWRDKVWSYCHEQLALFEAGKRDVPSVDELIAELPKLEW